MAVSVFAAASLLIPAPSGIQVFAWLTTMWRGQPRFGVPMPFVVAFLVTFLLGAITGAVVAAVPFDLQVQHDTQFVVAHLRRVLIGGMVFPLFAGLYHWFPKVPGRLMGERLGVASG